MTKVTKHNLFIPFLSFVLVLVTLFVAQSTRTSQLRSAGASNQILRTNTQSGSSVNSKTLTVDNVFAGEALLYIASVSTKPDVAVEGVSGMGLSWEKIASQCGGREATRTESWYAFGSPKTSGDVTAELNSVPKAGVIAVTSYSGVNSSTPIGNVVTKNSNGINSSDCDGGRDADQYSLNLTLSNKSLVYSAVSIRHYNHESQNGFVEFLQTKTSRGGGDDAGLALMDSLASGSSISVSGKTSSDVDYAVVAFQINPAQASSTPTSTRTPSPTPTPTPTRTPTPTSSATIKPTSSPTASPRPSATVTPRPTTTSGVPPFLPPVSETDPRITCSKYPEKRIFVETQAWWMDSKSIGTRSQIPLDGIGGHTHTATCFPEDQLITGRVMNFDVRLMLHKGNVGRVRWLDVGVGPGGSSIARVNFNTPLTCPGGSDPRVMCEVWVPISVDTSKIPSGYQELRFRFNVEQPNGERQFASTGWQAYYRSKSGGYRNYPWLEARGWYTGANYANARFLSPVPYEPVSGTWTINVAMVPGSGGVRVTYHGVHVDARFNLDDFGWVVKEGPGSYTGAVSIDTTKLTNGRHYLAIKTDQSLSNGGTNTGILQLPFIVQN